MNMEQLTLSEQAAGFLKETKKWAYFLAIMGFIGAAILLLIGIFMSVFFSAVDIFANLPERPDFPFPFGIIGMLYAVLAVVYFFPAYYLYKFSKEMSEALLIRDEAHLTAAFRFLKKHFKFIGIMVIVMIALYIVLVIGLVIFGMMSVLPAGGGTSSFV